MSLTLLDLYHVDIVPDPKHDPKNYLRYIASNILTSVTFTLILCAALSQTWYIWRYRTRWMLPMVIGLYAFGLGIGTRLGLHRYPDSSTLFIVEYLFVVLSPCSFIAVDYVLLGRIAEHTFSAESLLMSSRMITITFLSSDVASFFIQAIGGSIAVSATEADNMLAGSRIFLAGLVLQLLSFSIFVCTYLAFLYNIYSQKTRVWHHDQLKPWYNDWRALAAALFVSCVGILIRTSFRVVELSQGFVGQLATSEALFYGLDTLPLFVATSVYIPFWPGRFISGSTEEEETRKDHDGTSSRTSE